jgi:hypothetical protein
MEPVLDDAAARSLLGRRSPDAVVVTTRDLVQRAVSESLIDRDETRGSIVYADMLFTVSISRSVVTFGVEGRRLGQRVRFSGGPENLLVV